LSKVLLGIAAIVIFLWSALPVLGLILMSLSPPVDLVRLPPSVIPSRITFDNFIAVLFPEGYATSVQARRVPLALINSFGVGIVVSVVNVALGTLAGYAFARYTRLRFFNISLWALL